MEPISRPPAGSADLPLTVLAHVRARAGQEGELRDLLNSLLEPTRAEAGCVCYDLHQAVGDPTRFVFHEDWRSQADLDRHLASPHVASVLARLPGLLAEPPEITSWRRIG